MRSDSARFTRVEFMRANRNHLSRRQTTLSYGPQKDLYWLTLNVLIILAIILAWSISWGQLDNSAIRLLMFERVMPAYARWIDRSRGCKRGAAALFVACRFSLILPRLSFSLGKSRRRGAKTLSRGDGTDWGARPSDKRVINTSFVSKLEAPRWVSLSSSCRDLTHYLSRIVLFSSDNERSGRKRTTSSPT